jgi:4-hydroxybenzoate polyprenyltransferase
VDTAAAPRKRFDLVAYLKLFRFPLVFTAIADSAAGFLISADVNRGSIGAMSLLALASGGLYLFGMALNDLADFKKDKESAPNKVLPAGRVPLRSAKVAAGGVLALSLLAILFVDRTPLPQRLLVWGLTLTAILAYDLHWIKAPPIMGIVRALNFTLGAAAAQPIVWAGGEGLKAWKCAVAALPLFVYVSALTYVSTLEDGALDRRKLLRGAVFMMLGTLGATVAVPLIIMALTHGIFRWNGIQTLVPAGLLVLWIAWRARNARDRKGVMLMVRDGVAGIILLDTALVMSVEPLLQGVIVAALIVPALLSLSLFKRLA